MPSHIAFALKRERNTDFLLVVYLAKNFIEQRDEENRPDKHKKKHEEISIIA